MHQTFSPKWKLVSASVWKKVQNKWNDLIYTYFYQDGQFCDENYNVNQQVTEYFNSSIFLVVVDTNIYFKC